MSYLVRKITRSKWSGTNSLETLRADALTTDLKTTGDTLSLWEIEGEEKIDEAILALAVSKKIQKFEKMDLVLIPMESIHTSQLAVRKSPGDTFAKKLSETHREIYDLNYISLGIFAKIIIDLLIQKPHVTYTNKDVVKIVKTAYENNAFDISSLPEDMQTIIKK